MFPTDTADHADYVLPAATFLECDDVVAPYFDRAVLSAQVKAVEPPGEALPNTEIFRRLAAAMGFAEPELFETDAELIDGLLDGTELDWVSLAARGDGAYVHRADVAATSGSEPPAAGSRWRRPLRSPREWPEPPTVGRPATADRLAAGALARLGVESQLVLRQRRADPAPARPTVASVNADAAEQFRSGAGPSRSSW